MIQVRHSRGSISYSEVSDDEHNIDSVVFDMFTIEQVKTLAKVCEQSGAFLVLDEAYADYLPIRKRNTPF